MKRIFATLITLCMILCLFAGCTSSGEVTDNASQTKQGKVYYLNFKPEQDEAWQNLAKKYTEQTGVKVKVLTAAEGKYEETLTAEIEKTEAPTLFQVSGSVALESWGDFCLDLSQTDIYKELTSDDFALKKDGQVLGVAYVYEGFGLIVNKQLLKKAGYETDDIKDFESLTKVAEDITARSEELGFAAFTSPGLDSSSNWRFSGHLANLPLFYEFEDDGVTEQPATIKGTYLEQYKKIWDLYINNTTCKPAELSLKKGDDSIADFVNKKAVFYQNGTWAYSDVKSIGDENLGYLPIYFGVRDEDMGLCCGTENYWAVNKSAKQEDINATLDFLKWIVTSEEGTTALSQDMGFVSPFKSAKETENVLSNIMNEYVSKGHYNVSWAFNMTPNVDAWRSDVVTALTAYSASTGDWKAVETAFVDGWAEQYKKSH
ncbi:MAG: ABC transporter substrate-binding protein [Acutalibacteraceae bacterium]|nr:ABC transporter substrate-binding protein [Acutalibacteraceae bacterium]